MMARRDRRLKRCAGCCRCLIVGLALLIASCAVPARAALPTPDPTVPGSVSACPEHAGQMLRTAISSALYKSSIALSMYVPPCYASLADRLPVIYLLHGGNADETQWPDLRVQQAADDMIAHGAGPFVVVMPGGDYHASI